MPSFLPSGTTNVRPERNWGNSWRSGTSTTGRCPGGRYSAPRPRGARAHDWCKAPWGRAARWPSAPRRPRFRRVSRRIRRGIAPGWARSVPIRCGPARRGRRARSPNWRTGRAHGRRLRAQGRRHTWSPLTVADGTPRTAPVLLVDTTRHLTAVAVESPTTVRVQTGATMERLLAFLGDHRLGVTACPAPGDLTVGGVLAIGGHGTAVPAAGERRPEGHGYGTLSNQVTELTAVV
ncbi:FAD-binding protein [Streptomyces sp. NPDC052687]|uniref:FAD-binding protein n=1 Tax=Streptomyces sp. NPDC052687 TaxID=3154759 RepID=UPI00343881DE